MASRNVMNMNIPRIFNINFPKLLNGGI
jgi:hypothetical protein